VTLPAGIFKNGMLHAKQNGSRNLPFDQGHVSADRQESMVRA
jgi:hypothetical protein